MRPNCVCGHGYEKHGWGTTGCNVCLDKCLSYWQSQCGCGHAWEAHGLIDGNPNFLICPICGIHCEHWRKTMETEKSPENGQKHDVSCLCEKCTKPAPETKICANCNHGESFHYGHGQLCRACIHDTKLKLSECCGDFTTEKPEIFCKCGHAESEHDAGGDHSWCDGCLQTPNLPVKDCCKKFEESKYQDSMQDFPDCVCGHNYWMHGVTGKEDDTECTECFEDNKIPLASVCKKYRPKTEDSTEFEQANNAALAQITDGTVPKVKPYNSGSGYYGNYSQGTLYKHCDHPPFKAFDDHGIEIWCGTKSEVIGWDVQPSMTSFDVILNCTKSGAVLPHHKIPLSFGKKYTTKAQEIEIDWPDMGAPHLAASFWKDLYDYLIKTKGKMLIFCVGGHGRTGTALACMLVAARWKHRDAKNWIWKNYCQKAIETKSQEKYITAVETSLDELRAAKKIKK